MSFLIAEMVGALVVAALLGGAFAWVLRGMLAARELAAVKARFERLNRQRSAAARGSEPARPNPVDELQSSVLEQQLREHRERLAASEQRMAELESALAGKLASLEAVVAEDRPPTRQEAGSEELRGLRVELAPLDGPAAEDDLTRLTGIGPSIERALKELGVCRYAQIAGWSEAELESTLRELRRSVRSPIRHGSWIAEAARLEAERS